MRKEELRALIHKVIKKIKYSSKDYVIIGKKGILFEKFDNLHKN